MVKCNCKEEMEFSYEYEKGRHMRTVYKCYRCGTTKLIKGSTIENKTIKKW